MKKMILIVSGLICLLICGIIVGTMFNFLDVKGNSMQPTIKDGDKVIINKYTKKILNGDIIVMKSTHNNSTYIQRVIAGGGETIDIDYDNNNIYVNGALLNERYIINKIIDARRGMKFPSTVPIDCYFVLGDNRTSSLDSRDPEIGFVNKDQVLGKVIHIAHKN